MPRDLTFGSLFAGIGGIDLGFERAGMACKFQVEVDPFCTSVLAHHWPDVPRFGDIRALDTADLPQVDVLAGGFPCQPFSLAGRRQAQADPRHLWPEFARLVGDLQPTYVVGENVRGLCSKGLDEVLADLTRLGYDAEWQVVSAAALGAPHLRERIFIVAHADRAGLSDAQGGKGSPRPDWRPVFSAGAAPSRAHRWPLEPAVGRVAHGVPAGLDRLRALGNAVVPQVAEYVGRLIVDHARRT